MSNFNAYDLATLELTVTQPIEILEAHFGVGVMDFEVLAYANAHNIHPVAFSSLSEVGAATLARHTQDGPSRVLRSRLCRAPDGPRVVCVAQASTDLTTLHPVVAHVAAAHNISTAQVKPTCRR